MRNYLTKLMTGVAVAALAVLMIPPVAQAQSSGTGRLYKAPDFTLPDLDGKRYRLSDLKGKVVVINFWATWCPPCRKEIPDLRWIYDEYKDQGVEILGISLDQIDKSQIKKFVKDFKVNYPILHGTQSEHSKILNAYQAGQFLPTTFIIDREGVIRDVLVGMRTKDQFLTSIKPLL